MTTNVKINDLTAVANVTTGMQLETDIAGTTANKITVDQLSTYVTNSILPVSVANGGTGNTSLTSHGVLLGNGTSAITATAEMSDGELLIGSTGNNPVPATLTAGSGITITNAAGAITIASSGSAVSNPVIYGGNFTLNPFQRGSSFTGVTSGQFIADRFSWQQSGAGIVNSSQAVDSPTVANLGFYSNECLNITTSTAASTVNAGDFYGIQHKVWGYDFQKIMQTNFTVSFWVKASVAGVYCVAFQNGGATYSYVQEYTITTANTWQLVNFTIPATPIAGSWSSGNGIGLKVFFALAVGSTYQTTAGSWAAGNYYASGNQVNALATANNVFKVQCIKIDPGSSYIPYANPQYSLMLTELQKFFRKTYDLTTKPGVATSSGMAFILFPGTVPNASALISQTFPNMRATPTVTIYSPNSGTAGYGYNYQNVTDVALSVNYQAQSTFTIQNNSGASIANSPQIGYQYTLDAEL